MATGMFTVDTRRTFAALVLMATGRRTKFGTDEADIGPDGRPRWECQIAATWLAEPGRRPAAEVMSVTIPGTDDPASGLPLPCAIDLEGLRVGVSAPEAREGGRGIRGGRAYYSAEAIRPAATANGHARAAAEKPAG